MSESAAHSLTKVEKLTVCLLSKILFLIFFNISNYIYILKNIIYWLKKNDIFIVFKISNSKITKSKSAAKSAWLGALLSALPCRSKRARAIPCAVGSFAGEGARSLHIPTRFDTLLVRILLVGEFLALHFWHFIGQFSQLLIIIFLIEKLIAGKTLSSF